jgi:CheY-like chemotaxis protein
MKKMILLIDDDIDELFIFNEALNELPDHVDCSFAKSITEGVKVLDTMRPDYIFLDLNMPGINGYEAISILKNLDVSRNIPVILYSTAVDETVQAKALQLGARGCVKKTESIAGLSCILKNLTASQ